MSQVVSHWLVTGGLRIVVIVALALVLRRLISGALRRFERFAAASDEPGRTEQLRRARTLSQLVRNVTTVFLVAIASLMILQQFQIDVTAILTGAGILGLAIGFGAQTLVKDVVSGFFLILENQVRVGDVAEINGTGGLVEAINLRTILLRDVRGAVHVFPCGSVATLANLTKDYSYAVLDVKVGYRHDTDEVIDVLRATAAAIYKDPAFAPLVLEPLEVLGLENLGDSGVTIRVRMKTVPLHQWEVTRELRRRIKKAFADKGIEIPTVALVGARD